MPYADSEYPSIVRGKDKRESQRLLAAAPDMLQALRLFVEFVGETTDARQFLKRDRLSCKNCDGLPVDHMCVPCAAQYAIRKAEGVE
jgi:hypothetical protein